MSGGGSTHAWVQVYLPSAGWIEFDPTNGILGAATSSASPWRATRARRSRCTAHFSAPADAYVGMDVSVDIVAVEAEAEV